MRIRFYISTYDVTRWSDECVSGGEACAHDGYINIRHPHENYTLKEMFRTEYRKHCAENHSMRTKTMLIDIPDDIGFQFMMQGIQDNDYLAYNLYTERYAFGTDLDYADDATQEEESSSNSVYGKAISGSSNNTSMMFQWNTPEKKETRERITIRVENEFYNNLHEYCKPIIQHWILTKYYLIQSDLNTVLHDKEKNTFNNINYGTDPEPALVEDYESNSIRTVALGIDSLNYLFFQYVNDGEYFLGAKPELSDYHLDFLRRMYLHVHSKSTENLD